MAQSPHVSWHVTKSIHKSPVLRADGGGSSGSRVLGFDGSLDGGSLHIALPSQLAVAGYTVVANCPTTPGDRLTADSVPLEVRLARDAGPKSNLRETRNSAERDHILRALEETNWNVSAAARVLG
ncbi:MAG: helix-turn-helix domain-containing protein, partial [Bryobacteraceae bacterium]